MKIKSVSIDGLWGRYSMKWNLNPDVNVLSGINGSGKSTILLAIAGLISGKGLRQRYLNRFKKLTLEMSDNSRVSLRIATPLEDDADDRPNETRIWIVNCKYTQIISIDKEGGYPISENTFPIADCEFISTFDFPISKDDIKEAIRYVNYISNTHKISELDLILDNMVDRYRSYQIDLSTTMSKMMASGEASSETVKQLFGRKNTFLDLLDDLFQGAGKRMNRDKGEIEFIFDSDGKSHPYSELSAGEKQLLLILLAVFIQGEQEAILIMDEPEISLHIDWQNRLLSDIRKLNPNCQVIVSTHSPAMILDGWHSAVVNMEDITTSLS
ncbi:MAG: ATP-binding protein [Muribaculaceae bacterium]|nr:ATP-binding protein [Muribaculaceae bacterium]MDE6554182.1 ATP-binding protein [Muribaculaceae bacterium]MDE7349615.1 ATP-binding protein [Muribaculaceae bacterium]